MQWIPSDINLPIVEKSKYFIFVSLALVAISIIALATKGINYGIDFAGGYEIQVKFDKDVDVSAMKKALNEGLHMGEPVVQRFGSADLHEFLIRIKKTKSVDDASLQKAKKALEAAAGADAIQAFSYSSENGERVTIEATKTIADEVIAKAFGDQALKVQSVSASQRQDKPVYTVTLVSVGDRVDQILKSAFNIDKKESLLSRMDYVGPQVGEQLRNQGIQAVLYALVFILIYIALRFDFLFSPGAILALVHDVLITLGVFSIFGLEFNLPTIAALLTIVGYSLNDTIVEFDRIRELVAHFKDRQIDITVNQAINNCLSRTMITSLTTFLVTVALLIWGGSSIFDFSLALCIGVVAGTWSSIFIACPFYLWLKHKVDAKAAAAKGK